MKRRKKLCTIALLAGLLLSQLAVGTGADAAAVDGSWKKNSRGWWYSYSDGSYPAGEWASISGKWYYFNDRGYMVTGWQKIGKWYYFSESGAMVTGWKEIKGVWYFFNPGGAMQTGWRKIGGSWYFFNPDGSMVTGAKTIQGKSYIFSSSGVMLDKGIDISDVKVGDYIKFGNYEQDNDESNGKEAIEWRVLDKYSDGSILMVSKLGLDAKPYNDVLKPFTWESCTLRSWMNDDFLKEAFNESEQARIRTTDVVNDDNFFWGTEGGKDTKDKVFLLSSDEAKKYFVDDDGKYAGGDSHDRACGLTAYAISHGAWELTHSEWWAKNCWYWLRSPGMYTNYAAYVFRNGYVSYDYDGIDYMCGVVRPAIVLTP